MSRRACGISTLPGSVLGTPVDHKTVEQVGKLRPDVREGLGDKQTPRFRYGDASRPHNSGANGHVWHLGPDVREGMGD